ncbi:MAG TPA: hypothetical protein VKH63_13320 [Candidatus Acidoferrum sp.]|jgi:hypothetical protein|nr:hypothetical protein [Candidatus Acidoferrum sp.]
MKGLRNYRVLRALLACFQGSLLVMMLAPSAAAHNGPPFPIITDQRVGPCIISLWTHPDIGTGYFFVMVGPLPGGSIPKDLKVQVGVQPVSGRLAEVVYPAQLQDLRGQVEYKTEVQFDQQEFWRVRLILSSSAGGGEALSKVEATPPGFGRWDLLLYLLPFLGVGFLWVTAIVKRRRLRKVRPQRVS